jgi:DNA repair protein RadC
MQIAAAVLDASEGLSGMRRCSVDDLHGIEGLGPAKAARVLAAVELGRRALFQAAATRKRITSPHDIAAHLLPQFGSAPVEQFGVVLLDTRHQIVRTTLLSVGTLDASVVHPREVFREATIRRAAAIVLFHNHPSGDPSPSDDDVALTHRLVEAGTVMGIDVLDHVILGEDRYYSFQQGKRLR